MDTVTAVLSAASQSISEFTFWRNLSAGLGVFAGIVISIGVIHTKVISPFLAKPLAKALRKELADEVMFIVMSPMVQERIEETVASEIGVLLDHVETLTERVVQIEKNQTTMVEKQTSMGEQLSELLRHSRKNNPPTVH